MVSISYRAASCIPPLCWCRSRGGESERASETDGEREEAMHGGAIGTVFSVQSGDAALVAWVGGG